MNCFLVYELLWIWLGNSTISGLVSGFSIYYVRSKEADGSMTSPVNTMTIEQSSKYPEYVFFLAIIWSAV